MLKDMLLIYRGIQNLARAVEVVMVQAKRIYALIIKLDKLFFFLFLPLFSRGNREHLCFFLSSHRNTHASLRELINKWWKHLPPKGFLALANFHYCFYSLSRNGENVFYFLITAYFNCLIFVFYS